MDIEEGLERLRKASIAGGQAGSVGDELGTRDRQHAHFEGIWAMSRRWERSQARTGSLDSIRKSDRA